MSYEYNFTELRKWTEQDNKILTTLYRPSQILHSDTVYSNLTAYSATSKGRRLINGTEEQARCCTLPHANILSNLLKAKVVA